MGSHILYNNNLLAYVKKKVESICNLNAQNDPMIPEIRFFKDIEKIERILKNFRFMLCENSNYGNVFTVCSCYAFIRLARNLQSFDQMVFEMKETQFWENHIQSFEST